MSRRRIRFRTRPCRACGEKTRQRIRRGPDGKITRYDCTACEQRRRDRDHVKRIWSTMIYRCTNPRANNWAYYGGRGIRVCKRWRDSYEAFLADVGPRPTRDHSLDRIRKDGNYEPGNVRWATSKVQSYDHVKWLSVYGERKLISEWINGTDLTREEVVRRLKDGWTSAQAVLVPMGKGQFELNRRRA